MNLDERKIKILTAVIDEYIKTGEPVGSKTVSNLLSLSVSPATIRNDMVILEKKGFLDQPHTSSGRVPSYQGYRVYINEYMKPNVLTQEEKNTIDNLLGCQNFTLDNIIDNGLDILSEITGLTAVATINNINYSVITKVEVIPAGKRLYVLLVITSSGSVKNKVCKMNFDLLDEHILYFQKFINENISGVNLNEISKEVFEKLTISLGGYMMILSPLLKALHDITEDICSDNIGFKGEIKLLNYDDFNFDEVLDFLSSRKNDIFNLLSSAFEGVNVIFGKETDNFVITNSSLVMSKYNLGENISGSFGIIGPIRLEYSKVIPYIEYFSNSISKILYNEIEYEDMEGEYDYGRKQKKG